jgi:hypothetical protein
MTSYFYDIIREALIYYRTEEQAEYYALNLQDMKGWCEDMLDIAEVPKGPFRDAFISEMFAGNSEEPYELWRFIQNNCYPDEEEEEEEEELSHEENKQVDKLMEQLQELKKEDEERWKAKDKEEQREKFQKFLDGFWLEEYYRETRKELAEEDCLEIDQNPNCDSKISLRHFNWLNQQEDDEETEQIVKQRMLAKKN